MEPPGDIPTAGPTESIDNTDQSFWHQSDSTSRGSEKFGPIQKGNRQCGAIGCREALTPTSGAGQRYIVVDPIKNGSGTGNRQGAW